MPDNAFSRSSGFGTALLTIAHQNVTQHSQNEPAINMKLQTGTSKWIQAIISSL